jgi:hypothetical protein
MVKQNSIILIVLTLSIILACASYLYNQSTASPPAEPTATPVVTITPEPTATPTPSPTPCPTPTPQPVPIRTIDWAGYTWKVTDYTSKLFTTNNTWVDSDGFLHMKLIYDGSWHNFNLLREDAARYGTYQWTIVTDVDYIQDEKDGGNAYFVFAPYLYDDSLPSMAYGELDIELCRYGRQNQPYNTEWTIHPANHLVERNHFVGTNNTYTLEWMPDHITFAVEGPDQPAVDWTYTDKSGIPRDTGLMDDVIYIGQFQNAAPPDDLAYYEAEVVLSDYQFEPYVPTD